MNSKTRKNKSFNLCETNSDLWSFVNIWTVVTWVFLFVYAWIYEYEEANSQWTVLIDKRSIRKLNATWNFDCSKQITIRKSFSFIVFLLLITTISLINNKKTQHTHFNHFTYEIMFKLVLVCVISTKNYMKIDLFCIYYLYYCCLSLLLLFIYFSPTVKTRLMLSHQW